MPALAAISLLQHPPRSSLITPSSLRPHHENGDASASLSQPLLNIIYGERSNLFQHELDQRVTAPISCACEVSMEDHSWYGEDDAI